MSYWSTDYRSIDLLHLPGGRAASCATKAGTDPAEVYVMLSNDNGVTWGTPALAAEIDDTGHATCTLRRDERTGRLVLSNGFGVMRYSDAGGIADSWQDY